MSTQERDITLRNNERSNSNSILPNIGVTMSDSVSLIVRSADQTRKAAVSLPAALSVEQF
ncbi:hypothetical protein DSM106972_043270 [Dulcicalothrix desertica PCC 7102]|uniref:Uncharacterized protein n=1 Tax=Dulcicalothrix desertica PCC 7102 TaxID=232991 RepID=A0A3S1AN40_9CYAN|nr:hypothetical protein DSM106972_043270 [Dulcicalothrix desertica PCC 7102]